MARGFETDVSHVKLCAVKNCGLLAVHPYTIQMKIAPRVLTKKLYVLCTHHFDFSEMLQMGEDGSLRDLGKRR